MAKSKKTGGFMQRHGNRASKTLQENKGKEVDYGKGGELPEGIENGIAELVEVKIGQYKEGDNKGEDFFYAAGVVVSPVSHKGIKIEGRRTSITEALHDTPTRTRKTFEDHFSWMINELKKLGLDDSSLDEDNFEDSLEALKEARPRFSFRTWKGNPTSDFPNPRVNHQWQGAIAEEESNGAVKTSEEVEDESGDEELSLTEMGELADGGDEEYQKVLESKAETLNINAEEIADWAGVATAIEEADGAAEEEEQEEAEEEETETEEEETETASFAELGILADTDDSEEGEIALEALKGEATRRDVDPDEYETWAEFGEFLDSDSEEEEEFLPEVGEVWLHKPPRGRKYVQIEITSVNKKNKTVAAKEVDGRGKYAAVKFSSLKASDE